MIGVILNGFMLNVGFMDRGWFIFLEVVKWEILEYIILVFKIYVLYGILEGCSIGEFLLCLV